MFFLHRKIFKKLLERQHVFLYIVVMLGLIGNGNIWAEGVSSSKRVELEQQLQALEREAEQLDTSLQGVQNEKRTLASEIKTFETEIKRRELEIKRLTLAIRKAEIEIADASKAIAILTTKITRSRKALGAGLFLLYTYDQNSLLSVLIKHANISDFFHSLQNLEKVQTSLEGILSEFKENKTLLEKERDDLEQFEEEQQDLKGLQEVERRFLAQKKKEKDEILRLTKGKEVLFQQLLQSKKKDIATLKTQLFYLEKTGITAEEAVRAAQLAAKRAGIRTAFLLALLEVETGKQFEDGVISVGTNLGTGNWQRDLYQCYINLGKRGSAEAEKRAFLAITEKLNLDPDKMPVSRKPNYGCGGALGPAQFLPTTWLRFEEKVAELTGHQPPSPWNIDDAFTAAAIFLAGSGASSQTDAGELRAAKTYLSGNPSCKKYICRSYSNRIAALARDIDRIL